MGKDVVTDERGGERVGVWKKERDDEEEEEEEGNRGSEG